MDSYEEWIEDPDTGEMILVRHPVIKAKKVKSSFKKVKNTQCPATEIGRSKGGVSRAEKLSPERRREIARKAANARWMK